ncbi:MAG: DUF2179 domain-containing protein [Bacilli bacterium]|jgi:uncharacterized protein YebE (UPF0316 family)|nr:DUF2179 domain-containing protein [Bacilli bacterium]
MNYGLYIVIFLSKVIENALATLRLIIVANGKKWLGAILQFCIGLVWVIVTGVVVVNIQKDPLKIVFFALGSFVGSYVGSMIEEKIALGNNMVLVVINRELEELVTSAIRLENFAVTAIDGKGLKEEKSILIIMVPRKQRRYLVSIIKEIDANALIISEVARTINGGYQVAH